MRRSWFLFAAIAPLCATPALAQTTISTSTTAPVATSTAGDVTITSAGAINATGTTPVVTINSSNAVSNAGTIQVLNQSGATGVLIQGGNTGSFTNSGSILLTEDFTPPDANGDGITEAPYAQGANRFGVRVTGGSAFTGDILSSGLLTVEGSDSKGVSIEAPLQGRLIVSGATTIVGDRSTAISITAPVSGLVSVQGTTSVQGAGATAIDVQADVGGALSIYNTINVTGYGLAQRSPNDTNLKTIQGTPSEVQQSGPAVRIGANLGQGLWIGLAPPGTTSTTTTDGDGDGLPDNSVTAGAITSNGSAPGVLIGSASRSVTLGKFGINENGYGVILRGSVTGSGIYDGVSATGMQIGGLGGAVTINGGVRVFGNLSANAFEANATGLLIGAGATVPEVRVENTVSGVVGHSTAATTTPSLLSSGLRIEAGATVPVLTNLGNLIAQAQGDGASAAAVIDRSGTLTTILNQGNITAGVIAANTGVDVTGRAAALDLRLTTAGVTLTQSVNPTPIPLAIVSTGGVISTLTSPTTPTITGDILFGTGSNVFNLNGGTVAGALDFSSGPASFTINNGASYTGQLRHTGSALSIAVNSGTLTSTFAQVLQAQSLTVGAAGTLSFAVDPQANTAGGLNVLGTASFADGAKLGVTLNSILTQDRTYTLIRANSLTVGASGVGLVTTVPYVTIASLSTNASAGTINLNLRRRTAAEAGFNAGEAAAYDGVYTSLGLDTAIQGALISQTDRASFLNLYRQMLPEYAGGVFRLARAATEATARSAAESDSSPGSLWVQETVFGVDSTDSVAASYRGTGFGVVAGLDGADGTLGRLGATLAFNTGHIENQDIPTDDLQNFSEVEAGIHYRLVSGGLRIDARGTGGLVSYKTRREFLQTSGTTTLVQRNAAGKTKGFALSGRVGIGYEFGGPVFSIRPQTHVDYFRLRRNDYSETGGGDGFDLNFADRTGSSTTVTSSVVFTGGLGRSHAIRPSLEIGYRHGLAGSGGDTTASFKGGTVFSLPSPDIKGEDMGVARLGIKSSNEWFDLSLSAGAQARSDYLEGDLTFRARLTF